MTWNNRIFKHLIKDEVYYGLHETYYDDHGKVDGYIKNALTGLHSSVDELIGDLEQKLDDAKRFKEDILDYED